VWLVNPSEDRLGQEILAPSPTPLFFVSVDSGGVRERQLVSVDFKRTLSGFVMNRSEEFCKC